MKSKLRNPLSLLTLPQIFVLLALVAALIIALDLNKREQAGRLIGVDEASLQSDLSVEATRAVALQATLTYVESDEYVESYARNEGGMIQSGEKRVVPIPIETTPRPRATVSPTPDPVQDARPWQVWWQLLTDAPQPKP